MRKVITYSTLGENMKEVNSSATTWGELITDLNRAGIRTDGMRATEGETQVSFESAQAQLPDGDFSLFLMPAKVKSGYSIPDEDLIDDEDGITWNDIDWSDEDESINDYTFATPKDLALARAKKAMSLLERAFDTLGNMGNTAPSRVPAPERHVDPMIQRMREQAQQIQKNIDMFS